jgi:hypothetical protein
MYTYSAACTNKNNKALTRKNNSFFALEKRKTSKSDYTALIIKRHECAVPRKLFVAVQNFISKHQPHHYLQLIQRAVHITRAIEPAAAVAFM